MIPGAYPALGGRTLPEGGDIGDSGDRLAQLLATLLRNSGSAEMWAHGLVGMVRSTAEWWLDHRAAA